MLPHIYALSSYCFHKKSSRNGIKTVLSILRHQHKMFCVFCDVKSNIRMYEIYKNIKISK